MTEPPPDEPHESVYDLETPSHPQPGLPGNVVVRPTADEIIDSVSADLVVHAVNCVREFGDFHLAVSGGEAAEALYTRLMYDPNYRRLPWRRTHLWFVEERCVPSDDARSNYRLVGETLGDHADIPPEQFHPIFAQSASAAADYEVQLREALGWRERGQDRLDYVLLTLAADGSTAGLYPGVAAEGELMQRAQAPTDEHHDRVTMTLRFLNASRFVAVLAVGAAPAGAIRRVTEGAGEHEMPIAGIAPMNGELKWYLDYLACGVEDGGP